MSDTFKPMLAKEGDLSKITYPQLIQPKLDGIRACVVNGRLRSRTLKLIPNEEIQAALARPEFEGLDGELVVGDPRDPDAYRNTTTFVMSESKTGASWTYYVFDKWDHAGEYVQREHAAFVASAMHERIQMVATATVEDAAQLENMEAVLISQGYEGAILRDPRARYKFGRSGKTGPLLKVKRFIDFEAVVIGVFEEQHNANAARTNALGRTERSTMKSGMVGKGVLGGLVLKALNGPHEGQEFRCGTGFKAAERADLWNIAIFGDGHFDNGLKNRNGLNGRVAKVKSFPIGVKDAPRFPVFLGWRDMEVDG